jgi:hypothetical protein
VIAAGETGGASVTKTKTRKEKAPTRKQSVALPPFVQAVIYRYRRHLSHLDRKIDRPGRRRHCIEVEFDGRRKKGEGEEEGRERRKGERTACLTQRWKASNSAVHMPFSTS